MARSPDFGSYLINSRFLRLAFTTPTFTNLSSLIKYTRRPIMQKVQCHNHLRMQVTATYASQYLVSELFNASPWPLFTFPSQYSFTFGYLGFLGLVSGLTFSYFFFFFRSFYRFIYLYISSGKITRASPYSITTWLWPILGLLPSMVELFQAYSSQPYGTYILHAVRCHL